MGISFGLRRVVSFSPSIDLYVHCAGHTAYINKLNICPCELQVISVPVNVKQNQVYVSCLDLMAEIISVLFN